MGAWAGVSGFCTPGVASGLSDEGSRLGVDDSASDTDCMGSDFSQIHWGEDGFGDVRLGYL